MNRHKLLTQHYSTWGDKLLQHCDVLHGIQARRQFRPITVQFAPTEACDSDCPFCSVAGRPIKSRLPLPRIIKLLRDFWELGAKSLEITGGGNPLLYKDGGRTINDIIGIAFTLGYKIGVITNSRRLDRLSHLAADMLSWVRVSLIQLDEGAEPEDYDFTPIPTDKIGLSYIVYGPTDESPRLHRPYEGTTPATIAKIAKLVSYWPKIKFVRIAGDCLIKGNNAAVRDEYKALIDSLDKHGKFFVKDIGHDDVPFDAGCYVGMLRPYVAPAPDGSDYHVYTCTSHVLNRRTYDPAYALCKIDDVLTAWPKMNERFRACGAPYEVNGNGGKDWGKTCPHCFYANNNRLVHTVATELPDKDFA